jgi:hypothetical protein
MVETRVVTRSPIPEIAQRAAMNTSARDTLNAIFRQPVPADIRWNDIKSLFIASGAEIKQGKGSRIRVHCNGVRRTFHEPHKSETNKDLVRDVRQFLENAGVTPE